MDFITNFGGEELGFSGFEEDDDYDDDYFEISDEMEVEELMNYYKQKYGFERIAR